MGVFCCCSGFFKSLLIEKAAIAAEHAHYSSNKEITTSIRIYGITCPRLNVRISAGKPARHRRVAADSKAGRHTGERDTDRKSVV